jgi:hypothetical protein
LNEFQLTQNISLRSCALQYFFGKTPYETIIFVSENL